MKKIIEKEVTICDCCKKENYLDKCLNCGVEHCHNCQKTQGVIFNHAVNFSGSDDGYYCNQCNGELSRSKQDPLYNAYNKIKMLRDEAKKFYSIFDKKRKIAEHELGNLIKEHKKCQ